MSTSGDHFVDFWSQGQNASNRAFWSSFCRLLEPRPECLKSSLLELILSTSGAKAGKCSNQAFWMSFCRLLEPRPENAQIDPSGAHFVDFWSQGLKMLKSNLLELILSTSGAKAGMPQIEHSGAHFVDFWSQGQKVLKSRLLGVILSTSGAKARKRSNRASWASFCRLLQQNPESGQIEPPGRHFVDFWSKCQKVCGIIGDHLGSSDIILSGIIWDLALDHLESSGII